MAATEIKRSERPNVPRPGGVGPAEAGRPSASSRAGASARGAAHCEPIALRSEALAALAGQPAPIESRAKQAAFMSGGAITPILLVGNFLYATVGTKSVGEELAGRLDPTRWRVLTTSHRPGRVPRLIDMLRTVWFRRNDYALAQVDVFSGSAFLWAEAVCSTLRAAGKPYVLVLRGGNLPSFARERGSRVTRLLASARAVLTPSTYLREHMRPYRSDLILLPNPLDLKSYQFELRARPAPRIIWLRAFHAIYNPCLAPRVLALLAAEFPDVHLTMLGPDKGDGTRQATQREARDLGVEDRMAFPGRVPKPEISSWMNRGDIFLNTTNIDNTPMTVMEAMACGLCVVSTNVGGIPYLLRDRYDALLVPPNDPEAAASAVRRILTEPALAESLSRNAREKVESFDWSAVLPVWEKIFLSVAT